MSANRRDFLTQAAAALAVGAVAAPAAASVIPVEIAPTEATPAASLPPPSIDEFLNASPDWSGPNPPLGVVAATRDFDYGKAMLQQAIREATEKSYFRTAPNTILIQPSAMMNMSAWLHGSFDSVDERLGRLRSTLREQFQLRTIVSPDAKLPYELWHLTSDIGEAPSPESGDNRLQVIFAGPRLESPLDLLEMVEMHLQNLRHLATELVVPVQMFWNICNWGTFKRLRGNPELVKREFHRQFNLKLSVHDRSVAFLRGRMQPNPLTRFVVMQDLAEYAVWCRDNFEAAVLRFTCLTGRRPKRLALDNIVVKDICKWLPGTLLGFDDVAAWRTGMSVKMQAAYGIVLDIVDYKLDGLCQHTLRFNC